MVQNARSKTDSDDLLVGVVRSDTGVAITEELSDQWKINGVINPNKVLMQDCESEEELGTTPTHSSVSWMHEFFCLPAYALEPFIKSDELNFSYNSVELIILWVFLRI